MTIGGYLLSVGIGFLILAVIFRPLELAFPAKKQSFFRPDWLLDFSFFLGQYLLWGGLVFLAIEQLGFWIGNVSPGGWQEAVRSQPFWLQAIEVILLGDFLLYWGHRLQHRVGFLWRIHSVHHSIEHLDWLAAHREHPLDTIYTVALVNIPGFLLGFPLETLAGFFAFRGLWAGFIHSNTTLSPGPLRVILGAPELHRWHHSTDRASGNYANLCPIMDLIFGTYKNPGVAPEALGLDTPFPTTFIGQLLHPFRRQSHGKTIRDSRADLRGPPSVEMR
ncbi:MAG: sterol desaturase family protein [Verrucomicrobiales bacterium]|nr:sterol desaturase family protein [Verrucomicrobiales bacterium]